MIALLPGPPRELKPLFLEQVLPRLQRRVSGVRMFTRELRVTGLGESHVEAAHPADLYALRRREHHDPGRARRNSDSSAHLDGRRRARRNDARRNGRAALSWRSATASSPLRDSLEEVVAANSDAPIAPPLPRPKAARAACLRERLTRVAGSSTYFLGGVVCYSNELKTAWADVPAEIIAAKGAVSSEVADGAGGRHSPQRGQHAGRRHHRRRRARRRQRRKTRRHRAHRAVSCGGRERAPGRIFPATAKRSAVTLRQLALDMVRIHFLYNGNPQPAAKATDEAAIVRLFVAMEIPADMRRNLAALIQELRALSRHRQNGCARKICTHTEIHWRNGPAQLSDVQIRAGHNSFTKTG